MSSYNIRDFLDSSFDESQLASRIEAWEQRVNELLVRAGHDPKSGPMRFSSHVNLDPLGNKMKAEMIQEYRSIIGLDTVLGRMSRVGSSAPSEFLSQAGIPQSVNSRIMNIWSQLFSGKGIADDNPFGRFQNRPTGSSTLLDQIYSSINLQFNTNGSYVASGRGYETPGILTPSQHFSFGRIPKLATTQTGRVARSDLANKRMMVFDLETAGLTTGQVREVSYSTMDFGSDLTPGNMQNQTLLFRPHEFQRGVMMHGGRRMSPEAFLDAKHGLGISALPDGSPGDDFVTRMTPFLEQVRQVDYIAGHNISGFDIEQVFSGLAGTRRYAEDDVFRNYVDETYEMLPSKVVDTLTMAREAANLHGLQTHRALASRGKGSIYSIENLLLQTDLMQRIGVDKLADAMGYDEATGTLKKGLHFGDVDTLVTTGLLQHLDDLRAVPIDRVRMGKKERQLRSLITSHIKHQSAAITSVTDIRDLGAVHKDVRSLVGDVPVNPIEQEILLQRRLRSLPKGLLDKAGRGIPSANLLPNIGIFDRFTGRTKDMDYGDLYGAARPTGFSKFQKTMRERGMAFSGLSYEERLFSTAVADITSGVGKAPHAKFAVDNGIARWEMFDPETIQYVTSRTRKTTLPIQFLEAAGIAGKNDDITMLALSHVGETGSSKQSINLLYNLTDDNEAQNLYRVLNEANDDIARFAEIMGMNPDSKTTQDAFRRFKKGMDNGLVDAIGRTGSQGIAVMQLYEDQSAVERMVNFLKRMNNTSGGLSDKRGLQMRVMFAGYDPDAGIGTTAGGVLDMGLTSQHRSVLSQEVRLAQLLDDPSEGVDEMVDGKRILNRVPRKTGYMGMTSDAGIRNAAQWVKDGVDETVKRYLKINELKPKLAKFGIGALIAGAGMLAYNKKQDNDQYSTSFQEMPMDTGQGRYAIADHIQADLDMGFNGYRRQLDPLATASLSDNLYYGRMGHANMSWDRNSALYGGVL